MRPENDSLLPAGIQRRIAGRRVRLPTFNHELSTSWGLAACCISGFDSDLIAAMTSALPASLDAILKGTSRSFYLTLRVAPGPVRRQLGAAYLFCRAADTIADTALIPPRRRLDLLEVYRSQFEREEPDPTAARGLEEELTGRSSVADERLLLSSLERLFGVYLAFEARDRALIRRL